MKKLIFKIIALVIIANFIFTSAPIGVYAGLGNVDKLRTEPAVKRDGGDKIKVDLLIEGYKNKVVDLRLKGMLNLKVDQILEFGTVYTEESAPLIDLINKLTPQNIGEDYLLKIISTATEIINSNARAPKYNKTEDLTALPSQETLLVDLGNNVIKETRDFINELKQLRLADGGKTVTDKKIWISDKNMHTNFVKGFSGIANSIKELKERGIGALVIEIEEILQNAGALSALKEEIKGINPNFKIAVYSKERSKFNKFRGIIKEVADIVSSDSDSALNELNTKFNIPLNRIMFIDSKVNIQDIFSNFSIEFKLAEDKKDLSKYEFPENLAVDKEGNIFIAAMENGIIRLKPNGSLSVIEGTKQLDCRHIELDEEDNIYILDRIGHFHFIPRTKKGEYNFADKKDITFSPNIEHPNGFKISNDGKYIYITCYIPDVFRKLPNRRGNIFRVNRKTMEEEKIQVTGDMGYDIIEFENDLYVSASKVYFAGGEGLPFWANGIYKINFNKGSEEFTYFKNSAKRSGSGDLGMSSHLAKIGNKILVASGSRFYYFEPRKNVDIWDWDLIELRNITDLNNKSFLNKEGILSFSPEYILFVKDVNSQPILLVLDKTFEHECLRKFNFKDNGLMGLAIDTPNVTKKAINNREVEINPMLIGFANAIARIFQNEPTVVKSYKDFIEQQSVQFTNKEDYKKLLDLTGQIFEIPLLKVTEEKSKEIGGLQLTYEETVGEI